MTNFQPGDTVVVTSESTTRHGKVGVVTEVRASHPLPVLVRHEDGKVLGYSPWELAAASASDGECSCQPHPIFGHHDECRYVGTGR